MTPREAQDHRSAIGRSSGRVGVIAMFTYDVRPGRFDDFPAKLRQAADPKFNSPVMPVFFRISRNTVPGSKTGPVILMIEYTDMAAYGARTAFELSNAAWRALFASTPDAPERLVSVQLLTEITPGQAG